MKSQRGKGLLGLFAILICLAVCGFFGYDTMDDIKLGLDLAGGVSITYQAKEENPSAEDMSDTIYKLQQRVQNYSTEAEVYQEGDNRINVTFPAYPTPTPYWRNWESPVPWFSPMKKAM